MVLGHLLSNLISLDFFGIDIWFFTIYIEFTCRFYGVQPSHLQRIRVIDSFHVRLRPGDIHGYFLGRISLIIDTVSGIEHGVFHGNLGIILIGP